ncbi:ParB/RepB/Spo0J family partition protein [Persicobacter diffluens]|uniref:ParB-like N-terminal domain-containing protein n=1 Tax=Persicobacter diffluens TaxID=981 RepID=A0AAN4W528_9BACT|nr:hypothetical protein PEDI_49940 [Persicobacter diffluens]
MAKKQIKSGRGRRAVAINPVQESTVVKSVQSTENTEAVNEPRLDDYAIKDEIKAHIQGRDRYLSGIQFTSFDDPMIKIHPELQRLIPALTLAEREKLSGSIAQEGIREPVLIWKMPENGTFYIIDGHNRWQVARALKVMEIPYREMKFPDLEAVKQYMIDLQMGKRNLVKWQVSYFRGMKYERLKGQHGGKRSNQEVGGRYAEQLADEFGVSAMTILRDGKFYRGVQNLPEEVKDRFLARILVANKASVEKLGAFNTVVEKELLFGAFNIDEDNASPEDKSWFINYFAKPKESLSPSPFNLNDFKKKERAKVIRLAKKVDADTKIEVINFYQSLLEELKNY